MNIYLYPKSKTAQAMCLMLLSMASFALMNIIIRSIAGDMHSTQMVFIRNLISLFLMLGLSLVTQRRLPQLQTNRWSGHFYRAFAGLIAMQMWFHSVTIMPVTFATALSFTTPIFATIFAILFLKEQAGWRRWSALFVSFFGVILIVNPDMSNVNLNVAFVLFASAAMAVAGVFVKSLSRTEEPERIVFFMSMFMTPLSLPLALLHWQSVSWHVLGLLFVIGLLSTNAQLMMARAFARADMVTLLPLDFTRLIFTSIFAYLVFGETLDGQAWAGAAIIVAASVYIAHRENKNKAKI